ncbi:MAG: lysylphosphatidylglycerol synthetase family protein [Dyadobacter sp.]|uniref:phosphatidylglycerol lysyltransferase domain-containing protein n=1 Tax=Dyadobacter sp. TaxID=1914288 RepID=UPI001B2C0013|nr:phosphatidylglycerol lysyltransferase domain-containing protein [Dyadobacter sp.]MBO9616859.1 lysylphosphatidylglycerol synthetase family protein [Dyadobacter sp.]
MIMNSARTKISLKYPTFIAEHLRIIVQFLIGAFFIAIAGWFLAHQGRELADVQSFIGRASLGWLVAGVLLVVCYVMAQAWMYKCAFRSVGAGVSMSACLMLFLKRNLVSVFLPAGGVSALAFFSQDIKRHGTSQEQINLASTIYGFVGILTVLIVAIPAFSWAAMVSPIANSAWGSLLIVTLATAALFLLYRAVRAKSRFYIWLSQKLPSLAQFLQQLLSGQVRVRPMLATVAVSMLIECIGIAHLYVSMCALHIEPSIFAAVIAYVVSVIFMLASPFLRGMGAVELSTAYLLGQLGLSEDQAVATTLLYRIFEFWLPLLSGIFAFLRPANRFLMRIIPAFLLLTLGLVNILSALTPAIAERLHALESVIPIGVVTASNYFVFAAGLLLLVVAAFLLKGLQNAWYFAVLLAVLSCIGHLTKALDYEEAALSACVVVLLILTRKQYNVRTNQRLGFVGVSVSLLATALALVYGIAGFYFLDQSHFGIDFSIRESVRYTFSNFFLLETPLLPHDKFAAGFLHSIRLLGFSSMAFLIYTLARPYAHFLDPDEADLPEARSMVEKFGTGSLDYFKTYPDKLIFWSTRRTGFIAYRLSGKFAFVLETPVASSESEKKACIREFDRYCYRSGLKSVYYRVPEPQLGLFQRKRSVFLGQEAVVDLRNFTLEGPSRKSIRNAISKMRGLGYRPVIYQPPVAESVLAQLANISARWLQSTDRTELVFSQGLFDLEELRSQEIITAESPQGELAGFLNIIPDFAPGEATYDLIRKLPDAAGGTIDFLMVAMFDHLKSAGFQTVNLGLAPMSGLQDATRLPDKSVKFAYERLRSFAHYKGLREFKDKFSPSWRNQYMVYDEDYDLIGITSALSRVFRP